MSQPIDHAAVVAAAAQAVEATFNEWDATGNEEWARVVLHRLAALLHARRAARDAGYVECMISREAVAALRDCWSYQGEEHKVRVFVAMQLLARDLGPLIKEPA